MAYGDIIPDDSLSVNSEYRERNGVETVNRAIRIKDASSLGGGPVNHTSNHLDLNKYTAVSAQNRAGIYVGTQGNLCVLLSGQSDPVATGSSTSTVSAKLVDSTKTYIDSRDSNGTFIQQGDIVVNTTDNAAAFVSNVDTGNNRLDLVDASNSASNIMASGENYEIYRATLFQNIAAGSLLPIQVDRVFALGTTADDIIALY